MIYATKQRNVDLINMSIGGLPALNDGNNARAILYNRLDAQYKAQMFISAGNDGPGINTVGDPGVATDVVALGAYIHKDTWLNNYGAVADKTDACTASARAARARTAASSRRSSRPARPSRRRRCGSRATRSRHL